MSSQRRDWTNYLKDYKYKRPPLNKRYKPSGTRAIAQVLANWFGQILESTGYMPDKKGNVTFELSYNMFLSKACVTSVSTTLRKYLKEYGFTLRRGKGDSIEITKHS